MFDIGIGEILVLAVVGLLVFGPDRLPKAAADAGRWLRQIKVMAANAKTDLADSAGLDLSDTMGTVKELRDLHPKRWAAGMLDADDEAPKKKSSGTVGPVPFDPDVA
jgi:sec-independent protein translocase protein TatB